MAPLIRRTTSPASSKLPLLISLSKLFHFIPALLFGTASPNTSVYKRDSEHFSAFKHGDGGVIKPDDPPDSPQFMFKLIFSVVLVLAGGVFAGLVVPFGGKQVELSDLGSLTLALMGSDDLNLRVLAASSDDPREKNAARKVLKLLSRGRHWVLVVSKRLSCHSGTDYCLQVLLLGNVVSLTSPRVHS